jgi:hypothetical protein
MRFRRRLLFVEANLFVSGRFFHLWSELDDLCRVVQGIPISRFFGSWSVCRTRLLLPQLALPSLLRIPACCLRGCSAGVSIRMALPLPPALTGTESLNLSFFIRALQIAHDLIHIAVPQSNDSPTKPLLVM